MKKIDMHCHILPGIDDGSANPKETLAMLRMALNQDFVGMIVTPHGSVRNASVERVQEIRTLCKKFRIQAYQRLGVRLPVFPGQEIMYSVDTRQLLKEGKLLTLADSRYVLLEFLPGTAYSKIFSAVRQMQMAGYVPILAHVERYHVLREEGRLEELADTGARIQMNYSSIDGGWNNNTAQWCKRQELKELCVGVHKAEIMLGNETKEVTESERSNIFVARKSIVAKRKIMRGEMFSEENITCKRPGNGISPIHWYEVLGKEAEKDFEIDELISCKGVNREDE